MHNIKKRATALLCLCLVTAMLTPLLASCGGGKTAALEGGALYKISSDFSGFAMTVEAFGTVDKSNVILNKYDKHLSQMWRAVQRADGSYAFENMSSGLWLCLRRTSDADGTKLCGTICDDAEDAGGWKLETVSEGKYRMTALFSGSAAGIVGATKKQGAYVAQFKTDKSAEDQIWSFEKISDGKGDYPRVLILEGDYVGYSSTPEIFKFNDIYYNVNMTGPITVKTSSDLITWKKIGNVWQTKPEWFVKELGYDGVWAPGVYEIDGLYYCYYCVSSSGSRNSAIGVSVNTTLDPNSPDYKWVDKGMVIRSYDNSQYNCIDPNIIKDDDGQAWLVYGSHANGICVRKIDNKTGMLDESDPTYHRIARSNPTEAPYMIKRGDYYYLFCAIGTFSTGYFWAVGRGESVFGPFYDRDGIDMLNGGLTRLTEYKDCIEATGHASVLLDSDGTYYMVSEYWTDKDNSESKCSLHISKIAWSEDGWPVTALDRDVLSSLGE